jgi:hypothetical protein
MMQKDIKHAAAETFHSRKLTGPSQFGCAGVPPADAGHVKHGFRYAVDPQVLLDQRVLQGGGRKRRKPHSRCRQAERLPKVAGVEKDHSVCARVWVFPHGSREDAGRGCGSSLGSQLQASAFSNRRDTERQPNCRNTAARQSTVR